MKKLKWEGLTWTRQSTNVHDKPIKCSGCGNRSRETETFKSKEGVAQWCPECVRIVEAENS